MEEGEETTVKVCVRVRPLVASEEKCKNIMSYPSDNQILVNRDKSFTFDDVVPPTTSQESMYDSCVSNLVDSFLKGFNTTIFAYGQTGSGKTFTMGTSSNEHVTVENLGIVPRVIKQICNKMETDVTLLYDLKITFLEVYNDELVDLLNPQRAKNGLAAPLIREHPDGTIYVTGITEESVSTYEQLMDALDRGAKNRTTGATSMNEESSRSHAIFTMFLSQQKSPHLAKTDDASAAAAPAENEMYDPSDEILLSKFNFVDLAGSERLKRTNATGSRMKEGININVGLLALGNVISALGDPTRKGSHVPFRDAKITRLLQDSLGGNSKTMMIACVSPADSNLEETLNTLQYANRAKNIKNKAIINRDPHTAKLEKMRKRILELESALLRAGLGDLDMKDFGKYGTHVGSEELEFIKDQCASYEAEMKRLNKRVLEYQANIARLTDQLVAAESQRDIWREKAVKIGAGEPRDRQGENLDLSELALVEQKGREIVKLEQKLLIKQKALKRAVAIIDQMQEQYGAVPLLNIRGGLAVLVGDTNVMPVHSQGDENDPDAILEDGRASPVPSSASATKRPSAVNTSAAEEAQPNSPLSATGDNAVASQITAELSEHLKLLRQKRERRKQAAASPEDASPSADAETPSEKAKDNEDDDIVNEEDLDAADAELDMEDAPEGAEVDPERAAEYRVLNAMGKRKLRQHLTSMQQLQQAHASLNQDISQNQELLRELERTREHAQFMQRQYQNKIQQMELEVEKVQSDKDRLVRGMEAAPEDNNSANQQLFQKYQAKLQEMKEQIKLFKEKLKENEQLKRLTVSNESKMQKLTQRIEAARAQRAELSQRMKEKEVLHRSWMREKNRKMKEMYKDNIKNRYLMVSMLSNIERQKRQGRIKSEKITHLKEKLDSLAHAAGERRRQAVQEKRRPVYRAQPPTRGNNGARRAKDGDGDDEPFGDDDKDDEAAFEQSSIARLAADLKAEIDSAVKRSGEAGAPHYSREEPEFLPPALLDYKIFTRLRIRKLAEAKVAILHLLEQVIDLRRSSYVAGQGSARGGDITLPDAVALSWPGPQQSHSRARDSVTGLPPHGRPPAAPKDSSNSHNGAASRPERRERARMSSAPFSLPVAAGTASSASASTSGHGAHAEEKLMQPHASWNGSDSHAKVMRNSHSASNLPQSPATLRSSSATVPAPPPAVFAGALAAGPGGLAHRIEQLKNENRQLISLYRAKLADAADPASFTGSGAVASSPHVGSQMSSSGVPGSPLRPASRSSNGNPLLRPLSDGQGLGPAHGQGQGQQGQDGSMSARLSSNSYSGDGGASMIGMLSLASLPPQASSSSDSGLNRQTVAKLFSWGDAPPVTPTVSGALPKAKP